MASHIQLCQSSCCFGLSLPLARKSQVLSVLGFSDSPNRATDIASASGCGELDNSFQSVADHPTGISSGRPRLYIILAFSLSLYVC
jgi:hypothetical protein